MQTYIITGTTRGLGQALAAAALAQGDQVLTLSSAPDLEAPKRVNVQTDLNALAALPSTFDTLFAHFDPTHVDALILINNAGLLAPIMPLDQAAAGAIAGAFAVNLSAPAILIGHFLARTQELTLARRIINISSGAARVAYAGWGCYCSAKAGLDMLTRCVAEEQRLLDNPARICTVAPGVVDTDMQRQVRETSLAHFPRRNKFDRLHAEGGLATPEFVARRLLDLDAGGCFDQGGCHDLREFPPGSRTATPSRTSVNEAKVD